MTAHAGAISCRTVAILGRGPPGRYGANAAVVVGVHGIGQQDKSLTSCVLPVWSSALQAGPATAGFLQMAPNALAVAFFGDLFKTLGCPASGSVLYSVADIENGTPDTELPAVWYAEAVRLDPGLGPPSDAMMQRTPPRRFR